MKNSIRISCLCSSVLLSLVLVSIAFGQASREILTNAKIIELVNLGLPENVVVEKIRQSECQCDTSTDGLKMLSAAKVPSAVIMAMMNSGPGEKPYSESINEKPISKTDQSIPAKDASINGIDLSQIAEPGIYLYENGKMTLIEPTVYSGSKSNFLGTALTYGIKKSKIRATVRGKSANTQVKSSKPEFYFVFSREYGNSGAVMSGFGGYSATSPNEFMMIAMKVKENSREAVLGEFSAYTSSTGAADKDVREYSFEKLKPGLYKVVPKVDLATGEYCFYYAGTGGAGSKIFDFGVSH
ncbi:hypothetical protein BH10ACI3_BH10ACI3_26920 [soil metagenome]